MKKKTFAAVISLGLFASGTLCAEGNLTVGTWKLNPAKSKYTPGGAGPV
jgi:hypothetical protein